MPKSAWTSDKQTLFDYDVISGAAQVLYLGQAVFDVTPADPEWTIRKFSYVTAGDGSTQVDEIQVLGGVAWDDRATLAW